MPESRKEPESRTETGIYPAFAEEWGTMASVLYRAFYEDEDLRRLKRFSKEEFPQFFQIACQFFMESGKFAAWIYKEKSLPLGAILSIPSNWSAPLPYLFSFFLKLWKRIGWRALSSTFTILKSAWLSRPRKPCLRIIFLGVLPEARGKGLGRKLLKACERASTFSRLQLEVEKENLSAISLYRKMGFREEREFCIGKVPFLVMVKDLHENQKNHPLN